MGGGGRTSDFVYIKKGWTNLMASLENLVEIEIFWPNRIPWFTPNKDNGLAF